MEGVQSEAYLATAEPSSFASVIPIPIADVPMTAQEQKLVAGERLRFASLLVKF